MGRKNKLEEEFNIISEEELKQCNDISNALALINQEHCISDNPYEERKFIVEANEHLKNEVNKKSTLEEKTDDELDIISNQADQAFSDLMDLALNSTGKAVADISSSAQSFLNIKLTAKMAKLENKYKKLNYELQLKKLESTSKKKTDSNDNIENEEDVIIIED